jgi:hypothetical protein
MSVKGGLTGKTAWEGLGKRRCGVTRNESTQTHTHTHTHTHTTNMKTA